MSYSVFTPFLRRFTDEVHLERSETIALYNQVRSDHINSPWASPDIVERISNHVANILGQALDIPQHLPLAEALDRCSQEIVALETTIVSFPEINWNRAQLSMKEGVDLRRFLRAKQYFLANQDRVFTELQTAVGNIFGGIIQSVPPMSDVDSIFTQPLHSLVENPGELIQGIIGVVAAENVVQFGLFTQLLDRLYENVCYASGITPHTDSKRVLKTPDQSDLPPAELVETYLAGTPFLELFCIPIPFSIPEETRLSGQWIIAPPGRGKTTLLHSMFLEDAGRDASVIIMDSKGDLSSAIAPRATLSAA